MTAIKIYLDEDVHSYIAPALRLRGWDALTTEEAEERGNEDIDQIRFATRRGHSILTYNVNDFPRLHYEIIGRGDSHTGIIVGARNKVEGATPRLCLPGRVTTANNQRHRRAALLRFGKS